MITYETLLQMKTVASYFAMKMKELFFAMNPCVVSKPLRLFETRVTFKALMRFFIGMSQQM